MKKILLFVVIAFSMISSVQAQAWQEVSACPQAKHYINAEKVKVKDDLGEKQVRYVEKVVLSSYERPPAQPKQKRKKKPSGITSESAAAFITGAAGGASAYRPSAGGPSMLKFKRPYKAYMEVKTLGCKSYRQSKQLRKHYDAKGNAVESFTEEDLRTHYEKSYPSDNAVKKYIYQTYCKS